MAHFVVKNKKKRNAQDNWVLRFFIYRSYGLQ